MSAASVSGARSGPVGEAFNATGQDWTALLGVLGQAADDVVFGNPRVDSDLARAEGLRHIIRLIAQGALSELEAHDPAFPRLVQIATPFIQWGLPNPDCLYLWASVDGSYRYRIWGDRGTAHLFHVEVTAGDLARFRDMKVYAGRHDFATSPEGEIEIILSQEECDGNWVGLPPGAGYVTIRQYCYDWPNERPARLTLERIGAPYPPPAPTTAYLTERLELLVDFLRDMPTLCAKAVEQYFAAPADSIPFPPLAFDTDRGHSDQLGFQGLHYGQGHFRCGEDEAVILEVEPPQCRYWNFQVTNQFWEGMEWDLRQTSINGHQAVLDRDDRFRAVIAHRDPGVPNWLDTGSHHIGLISGRYYEPKSIPIPTLRTVPFDEIRGALPSETPNITPAARQDVLRARMLSVPAHALLQNTK